MSPSRRSTTRGFTLIELMLVVALIGILSTLAIGVSSTWRRRQDHRELTREVFAALSAARAHSLKFGVKTKVNFDDDNHKVTAFVEPTATADCVYTGAGGESVVYQYPKSGLSKWKNWVGISNVYDYDMSVTLDDPAACNGQHTVVFEHRGFSVSLADAPRSPTVTVADAVSGEAMTVKVSVAGALRIE